MSRLSLGLYCMFEYGLANLFKAYILREHLLGEREHLLGETKSGVRGVQDSLYLIVTLI